MKNAATVCWKPTSNRATSAQLNTQTQRVQPQTGASPGLILGDPQHSYTGVPVSGRRQNSSHYVQQTADRRHSPSTTNQGAPGGRGREKTGTERRLDSSRGDTSVGRGTIFTRSPWGRPAARATGTGAQTEGPASSGWWDGQWLPPTATRPTPAAVRHPPQGARQPTSTPTNERTTRTTKAPTETPKGDERSQPRGERGRGRSECEGAPQTCAGWKEMGEQSQAP